ncbi:unnamed protein product [Rotaria sp. Silwood1]|nr:unnamed protein product [Rotaria sp. Silwood1]CAF1641152.1 unnamed protein product [Rotaria sp. Silwood1]
MFNSKRPCVRKDCPLAQRTVRDGDLIGINYPLRSPFSTNIHPNARWQQNGITVAGGNRQGNGINQLSNPWGLYVDDDQTIYVADQSNHRIVEWKRGATSGQVVAGGNGQGSGDHQLDDPYDVIIDKERDSLIICDTSNGRVVRWPRRNGTSGETIISNISCWGLTMDENGSLYITDYGEAEVRRYRRGESQGTVVAGGNGRGNRLDQLSFPRYVFVDRDHSVYVSDRINHRVMKWMEGAKQGIVVAGGQGEGNDLTQLSSPLGVVVDQLGTVYVADAGNNQIMRWHKGATQGSVIVGGNGKGEQSNQLNGPIATRTSYCFHFTQAIYRAIQRVGLSTSYNNNDGVNQYCRKLMALRLFPEAIIENTYDELIATMSINLRNVLNDLMEYFQEEWFLKVSISQWYVHGMNMRTNNNAEAFHSRFNHRVQVNHPNIWSFIQFLQGEENSFHHMRIQFSAGLGPRPKQAKAIAIQRRIDNLGKRYYDCAINAMEYFDGLSFIVAKRKK